MEQTVTAKLRVYPDAEQADILYASMKAYADACSMVSTHVYETHDLSQASLNRKLYRQIRDAFGLPSQMAQSSIRSVIAAYKSMQSNGRWELAVFRRQFCELVWNRDYSLVQGQFSVNTLQGRQKLGFTDKGLAKYLDGKAYRFGQAKLLSRGGKFYLHIAVTGDVPDADRDCICNVVGVDRGINFIAAAYSSDGKSTFFSGRQAKAKRANYRRLRRELQSRHTRSARRRLQAVGRRENRWMADVNHQVSKALVEANPVGTLFVLENLKGCRERMIVPYGKSRKPVLVGWAYLDLEGKLIYKAARAGSMVIKANPAYTSQACPRCGHTERANRDKKMHLFTCKRCGYRSNDDRIAAMNLHRKGIEWMVPDDPGADADGHACPQGDLSVSP